MTTTDAQMASTSRMPHTVISVTQRQSLRQCNSCVARHRLPDFHSPGAVCSYSIPVEIKSKTQLVAVMRSVTEIQTQRIMMGRFAEEIQGEHNPDLGKEMDRLFSMLERWRNIEDNRDTVKMTLESKGNGSGQRWAFSPGSSVSVLARTPRSWRIPSTATT